MSEESQSSNPSSLRQFLTSIATIPGDLSNITAPPFVLADKSTTEFPSSWAEHPKTLIAPASASDPLDRARLVLRWLLASLKRMQYAGRTEDQGVKKPLNAFLGELFLGEWQDEQAGKTRLISEQVSHHPPVTACYISNEKTGITAQGYMRQKISLTKTFGIRIEQMGHALLTIPHVNNGTNNNNAQQNGAEAETYLITLPIVTVKDLLSGAPYPELSSAAYIISTSGYISKIDFSGKKSFFSSNSSSSRKNTLHATVFHRDDPSQTPLIEADGQWNDVITFYDLRAGNSSQEKLSEKEKRKEIERYDTSDPANAPTPLSNLSDMDPWESRRAWSGVIDAVRRGDMTSVSREKSKVEEAQRAKRREEEAAGKTFEQIFFKRAGQSDKAVEELLASVEGAGELKTNETDGVWRFIGEQDADERLRSKPLRGDEVPW